MGSDKGLEPVIRPMNLSICGSKFKVEETEESETG